MEGSAKIRIKVGLMELDYEGDPSFLKDGLIDLLHKMSGFVDAGTEVAGPDLGGTEKEATTTSPSKTNGTSISTTTFAANLGAQSCSDLVIAALAKVQISDGADGVGRKDILAEMKTATGYYKQNMAGNLSKALTTLVKGGRLNQLADDRYSLRAAEKQKIEAKVAGI